MINEEQIRKYQEIYKKVYGKEVSRDKALSSGIKLIEMVRLLLKKEMTPEERRKYELIRLITSTKELALIMLTGRYLFTLTRVQNKMPELWPISEAEVPGRSTSGKKKPLKN